MEQKVDSALKSTQEWGEKSKLTFSAEKKNGILLKGNLKQRPGQMVNEVQGQIVNELKYLIVILGSRLEFHAHVGYVANKAVLMF
ncbi:hypothetical protein PR048_013562 [Dryococelus australis]|uniref:Uncharacterized protein n=1 Tax=Dryococelus australis TaxID=614101 RepID=A0ABQ9HSY4_9NEOP|nr:hypothetical protein PR048_013562 [Dryococelus australis]